LRYLKDTDALVKKWSGKTLIVYIPEREQIYEGQWERILQQFDLDEKAYDLLRPNKILRDFCVKESIAFLDLTLRLRKATSKTEMYFTMDPHLNSKGHYVAAQLIYEKIVNDKLIPLK
jgi:hypothetical protein